RAASRRRFDELTPTAGRAAAATNLWNDARGLGVSVALPRWVALHRLDSRSRAPACAAPLRRRKPLHGQPATHRARAGDPDARPHSCPARGGAHQTPAPAGEARAADLCRPPTMHTAERGHTL